MAEACRTGLAELPSRNLTSLRSAHSLLCLTVCIRHVLPSLPPCLLSIPFSEAIVTQTFLQEFYPFLDLISSAPHLPVPGAPCWVSLQNKNEENPFVGPSGERQNQTSCLCASTQLWQRAITKQVYKQGEKSSGKHPNRGMWVSCVCNRGSPQTSQTHTCIPLVQGRI